MWSNIVDGLGTIVTDPVLLLVILLGSAIGILGGVIPGLTSASTLAILMPLTFTMDSITSLTLLAAAFTGAIYGGSITATLLNTPGTPEAAIMTADGYSMTRKGQAGEALWTALLAGTIGGVLSTLVLIVAAVPLADEALNFGPAEYFMLTVFGLSVLSSIVEGSLVKSVAVVAVGLSLSIIGLDPITGVPRYTFGATELFGGIPMIPVLIGLFAVAEGLVRIRSTEKAIRIPRVKLLQSLPRGRLLGRVTRFSFLGFLVGMVIGVKPGGGATVASVLSYNVARQVSSRRAEFGKGVPEGLAAPEGADKATVGAAMIPLLTLGLPATTSAAIIIGAFQIHGIAPGPLLFSQNTSLVYALMLALFLANFAVLLIGITMMRPLTRIAALPPRALGVGIIAMSLAGSYIVERSVMGVWFAVIAGLVGYLMNRYGFPVTPLLLSLILGPLLESNLRRALTISRGDWGVFIDHKISLVLFILAVASFVIPIGFAVRRAVRNRRQNRSGAGRSQSSTEESSHSDVATGAEVDARRG